MKAAIGWLIGLVFAVSASAEPLLEGRVRLESGEPVADAQVRLFDLTDLRQGASGSRPDGWHGVFRVAVSGVEQAAPCRKASPWGRITPIRSIPRRSYPINWRLRLPTCGWRCSTCWGNALATLVDGERAGGLSHGDNGTATDAAGRAVGAGVYIYRMTVGVESQTGRMVLIDGQAGVSAGGAASVWSGASGGGRSDGAGEHVYELIVSGEGLVPYVDSSFRVEAGMTSVELVLSSGRHPTPEEEDGAAEEPVLVTPAGKILASADALGEPTNLRVEEITDSSARVRWNAVEGATDYDINYKTAVGGKWTYEPHKGTRLYNTIYDLKPSTEYRWAVRAKNSDGPSDWVGANFTTRAEGPEEDGSSEEPDSPVTIPDTKLRAAIRVALGKASGATITVAEMATLVRLEVKDAGISDLTGLEFATNLTGLVLFGNTITDLSVLAGLTKLEVLVLSGNQIRDISALSGLTNLKDLQLRGNPLSASSINEHIPALQDRGVTVDFDPTPSTITDDPTPVTIPDAKLRAAIRAALGKASGATITVAEMKTLTTLKKSYLGISDLTGLEFATNLRRLTLNGNDLADISALGRLTKLRELWLWGNNISDISALSGLTNLTLLRLGSNDLADISALRRLTKLRELWLPDNNISDISALSGLTNLTHLRIYSNDLTDISALAGLINLRWLFPGKHRFPGGFGLKYVKLTEI